MNDRINGSLKSWNEQKGFGFIAPSNGGADVFVHISDFPKRGGPPRIGEPLAFAVALNKDGKKKAVGVQRPGGDAVGARQAQSRGPVRGSPSLLGRVGGFLLVAVVFAAIAYEFLSPRFNAASRNAALLAPTPVAAESIQFQCDGRTHCSQMTSCAEASFFLQNCPNTEMDGDGDGVPCESQWCTGSLNR